MPLQATSGAASYDAFGGGVASVPQYIEDVFSTYLYAGNESTQAIPNGIDLSTKGGLVWLKARDIALSNWLFDTQRGSSNRISSNSTSAQASASGWINSFDTNGFTLGSNGNVNGKDAGTSVPYNYASWTFRKQPKFFDVLTYTGDGNTFQTISHNLGSEPGCVIVKQTNASTNWVVYHRGIGTDTLRLNLTNAKTGLGGALLPSPTNIDFYGSGGADPLNASGGTYVAYLFAHDAGGFGLTGTDNVISCGSYTGSSSSDVVVNLGYEPQWVMIKKTNGSDNWLMFDSMRGLTVKGQKDAYLWANSSNYENQFWGASDYLYPTATGFALEAGYGEVSADGFNYIYIAIRRGPMKVPTSGTSVLNITTSAGTSPAYVSSFPVDVALRYQITGGDPTLQARLAGPKKGWTDYDFSESSDANVTWDYQNGMFTSVGANANQYGWLMRRAPSFMDVVCYTNPPSSPVDQTHAHNLGVVPTLVITKGRNQAGGWIVLLDSSILGSVKYMYLNTTAAAASGLTYSATTTQYTTSFIGNYNETQVAYLFATCPNVSKVGSYTGNGTTQTINCGFTGGARFVIIKRTDSTGGWYVYDTDRGMTVLTDPYFFLNDSAAQVATLGSVTTVSTGFALDSTILAAINVSSASYLFLAIS